MDIFTIGGVLIIFSLVVLFASIFKVSHNADEELKRMGLLD